MLSAIEWKELLRRYIDHIYDQEGSTYVGSMLYPDGLSDAALAELRALAGEIELRREQWRGVHGYSVPWTLEEAKRLETPDTGPGPVGGEQG